MKSSNWHQQKERGPVILSMVTSGGKGQAEYTSNYHTWHKDWKEFRIQSFGKLISQQFADGASPVYNSANLILQYPIAEILPVDKDSWVPTEDEYTMIDAGANTTARDRIRNQLFNEWAAPRRALNRARQVTNDENTVRRNEIIKREDSAKDEACKVFSKILDTMTPTSRQMIVQHQVELEDGGTYGFNDAVAEDNWYFLFEAARATHLIRNPSTDAITIEIRRHQEEERLRSMSHKTGTRFLTWLERFRDQMDTCQSIDVELSEPKLKMYFMSNLHPQLFEHTLVLWNNAFTRDSNFNDDFETLVIKICNAYTETITQNPALVRRCEQSKKAEEWSFSAGEKGGKEHVKSESKHELKFGDAYVYREGSKCPLCKKKHDPKDCERFNSKFSLGHQIEFWKKKDAKSKGVGASGKDKDRERSNAAKSSESKSDEIDDADPEEKWVPTKGTMVIPSKSKKANFLRCNFARALEAAESRGDSTFPASLEPPKLECCMAGEEFVKFTLDTGTETGTVDKKDRHLLIDVREDRCTLLGVSGTVELTEIGSYIFGNARVLGDNAGRNLVSFAEAGPTFQLINPDPKTLILQGWPGTVLHATKFYFVQDEDQFGDRLFHCSMPKSVYNDVKKRTLKLERSCSFYRPSSKGESIDYETSVIEAVENMHVLYNHASANQLIRILEHGDHHESLSATDVLAWKELRGDYCTGCVVGKMKNHSLKPSTNEAKSRFSGVGDGAGDLMFVDRPSGPRTPAYVHLDRGPSLFSSSQ